MVFETPKILFPALNIGYPTIEEFTKMIENHLSINYNVSMPKQVGLFALWPHSLNKDSLTEFQNEWLLKSTEKNLWTLSLDTEYVFSRLFKEYGVFPEVMGTCGGLYVVEKLEPINMPSFIQSVEMQNRDIHKLFFVLQSYYTVCSSWVFSNAETLWYIYYQEK